MHLHVVDDEQIAPVQTEQAIAHPERNRAIQREEEFKAFVPGRAGGELAGMKMEEADVKGKLTMQLHVITSACVEEAADVVGGKAQALCLGQELLKWIHPAAL